MSKKKFTEARLLDKALIVARDLRFSRLTMTIYSVYSDLKAAEGNSTESIMYMHRYYQVKDSLIRTRKIVELEARDEAEQKLLAIQKLEQEKRVQNVWIAFLVIGSIVLSAALFVIYKLQRSRNEKAVQLLDVQRQLNVKLTETDQLKSRFFANISHEFRTPLSLILAPIERKLNQNNITEADREDLRLVKRNAHRLLDLINQLLDLSKLESRMAR